MFAFLSVCHFRLAYCEWHRRVKYRPKNLHLAIAVIVMRNMLHLQNSGAAPLNHIRRLSAKCHYWLSVVRRFQQILTHARSEEMPLRDPVAFTTQHNGAAFLCCRYFANTCFWNDFNLSQRGECNHVNNKAIKYATHMIANQIHFRK